MICWHTFRDALLRVMKRHRSNIVQANLSVLPTTSEAFGLDRIADAQTFDPLTVT